MGWRAWGEVEKPGQHITSYVGGDYGVMNLSLIQASEVHTAWLWSLLMPHTSPFIGEHEKAFSGITTMYHVMERVTKFGPRGAKYRKDTIFILINHVHP